nr:immunoglobulin light chain junction region [Macaca mulatta]MOX49577.1 immunoglobulin light chain junction region [Macaca mulatta]MOX50757.1 immunoglobulin light chain junction region [Macaca mulatta]MOX50971.1 immunoglobulin light chain junction region [Macaca mulatta]
CQHYSTSPYSF